MKNAFRFITVIISLSIIAMGCSEEDGNNNNNLQSTGYLEFKIDSTLYRIDDYNTNAGNGTVFFTNTPSLPLYQLTLGFNTASASSAQNITLQQLSPNPLEVKNYIYSSFNVSERPTFVQVLPSLYTYAFGSTSTANVEITRLDTISGGKVEGEFNLYGLDYSDSNGNLVSSGHNLTEGKFSVVVD